MTIHLLHGDDDLLLHRATSDLVERLTADDGDLAFDVHQAVELEHLPSLRTTSLFGERTGVVIRGLEAVPASNALKGELVDYLDNPDPEAVVVLVARGTGRIRAIVNRVKKVGTIHEHKLPPEWQERSWDAIVRDEFARHGVTADVEVVRAVRRHAGTDTATIASQVGQVVATREGDGALTGQHVDEVVGGHGRESTFAFVDAVVARDPEAALASLRGLLTAGDAPVMIAGALVWRFRALLAARGGGDFREAGVSPAMFRRLRPLAFDNFGAGELAWAQDRLARLDVDLKGGSALPSAIVLEVATIDLATPRAVSGRFNPSA